jgi:hypothetical protein
VKKGFCEKEGPFVKTLDNALQSFGVQRQQYFSGAFIGNHVHKALKVEFFIMQIKIHITWLLFSATQCQDPLYINLTNGTTTTAPSI